MSGARRFLLVLVLASIICVFLIQVTLDGWNFRGIILNGVNQNKTDFIQEANHKDVSNNFFTKFHLTSITKTITDTYKTKNLQKIHSTPKVKIKKTEKIGENKIQVRRLPLANRSSRNSNHQTLVSKHERINEILKHSNTIRRRMLVDPFKSIKSLPIVNPKQVNRVLILTYFRAGSTFIGDLLQQNWKTFYHFEPLHSKTYDSRIDDNETAEAFKLFNSIFRCNFTGLEDYMNWVKRPRNQFLFAHNHFLWVSCHSNPKICFNPSFVNAVCQRASVHVMKVTRLHMHHLEAYLNQNPDLNLKVVYLTRDPRGIISSRWTLDWCNGTDCSDPGVLCKEMADDIVVFEKLQKKQPLNFIKVRYEDLSLNTYNETQRLFKFLKLPFSQFVQKFLKTHTVSRRIDSNNPYSTRRNTTAMAFSWRERFRFDQVLQVQSECLQVLHHLNHSLITSSDQLPNPNGTKPMNHSNILKIKNVVITKDNLQTKNNLPFKSLVNATALINGSNYVIMNNIIHNSTLSQIQNFNNTNIEIHKTYKFSNLTNIDKV